MPEITADNPEIGRVFEEVAALGLESHIAELEAFGLTVIPAEKVAPPGFTERLRDTILELTEQRMGVRLDTEQGRCHADIDATAGQKGETWLWRILFDDPVFEQALMNPTQLVMVTYLLGYSAKLSNSSAIVKGPVTWNGPSQPLGLHSDNRGVPAPFPLYAQVANATWVLTDYTLDNGCIGYVPGSHRLCRHPTPDEAHDAVVPVEAPAGSLLIWHGNTWHAPFPRTVPGLRVSMLNYFCRDYFTPQERYRDDVPADMLDRNPPRFRTLMGLDDGYGWGSEGPDTKQLRASRAGQSQQS
jgi:hypothetical protein